MRRLSPALILILAALLLDRVAGGAYIPPVLQVATAQDTAPPASGVTTTATGGAGCIVYGTLSLVASVAAVAGYTIEVENGVASGAYNTVVAPSLGVGLTVTQTASFNFFVPTGRRWKLTALGLGGTESIPDYSYACW